MAFETKKACKKAFVPLGKRLSTTMPQNEYIEEHVKVKALEAIDADD